IVAAVVALRHPAAPAEAPADSFESMKIATLTSSGRVRQAAISPDGNYLAHAVEENGRYALLVKQIATGSDIRIVEGLENPVRGVTFSPDGNYVDYVNQETGGPGYSTLFQAPTLGGSPRKILFDIDAAVAISPDGKQIAFPRGYPAENASALMVASADGSGERRLATRKNPDNFALSSVSWAPDGKSIAAIAFVGTKASQVLSVDVGSGRTDPLGASTWRRIRSVQWLPDGSGLLVVGRAEMGDRNQIWRLSPSGERAARITNDLNDYGGLSLTASGDRLVTVQNGGFGNLWILPDGTTASAKQVTLATRNDNSIFGVSRGPGTSVLIGGSENGKGHIWRIDGGGANRTSLSPAGWNAGNAILSHDGKFIVFSASKEDGVSHVWRMDADGTNAVQLTTGAGEQLSDISPDDRWVLYYRPDVNQLWRVPAAGGEGKLYYERSDFGAALSPDGRYLAAGTFQRSPQEGLLLRTVLVVPAEGGDPVHTIDWPDGDQLGWMPDGSALVHVLAEGGADNLWTLPLDGGKGRQLTTFPSGRIYSWAWAADGKGLLLSRGEAIDDAVMISNFR
ncbi:MAG TPA: hypothetical protein VNI57_14320, partial [Candidatus Saccharimonadales bacterium]|nr:hypothetical protein [Candidatus Saccharimonadales bacterium]